MVAKPSKPVRAGYGLCERLLLAFIAISGFAVVAAAVGNYAFYAIGEALRQVTESRSLRPSQPWNWRSGLSVSLLPDPRCSRQPIARSLL